MAIADRYLGFDLAAVPNDFVEPLDDQSQRWLFGIRGQLPVPDIDAAVHAFIGAGDASTAVVVSREHPVLLDPTWRPVIEHGLVLTAAAQDDQGARRAVELRATLLSDSPLVWTLADYRHR